MYTVRIHSELDNRLDAEFYNPLALKTVEKIRAHGKTSSLGQLISNGYRVVYHGTDSIKGITEDKLLPFLSPTQIDDQGAIDFDAVDKLPLCYKDDYPKGLALAGELLIEVKGNVSKVGVVPDTFPKNLMISGSLYKATFNADTDSRYVLAFLKSRHGQTLKNRLTSNTIISYIAKDALYSIPLLVVDTRAQKYIGDKVRQAERLRACAKVIYAKVAIKFETLLGSYDKTDTHFERVSPNLLADRLDQNHYKKSLLNCLKLLRSHSHASLSDSSYFLGLTDGDHGNPKYGPGPIYLRASEMSGGLIALNSVVTLESEYADRVSASCWARPGEVIFSVVGTLGLTAIVDEQTTGVMSRGVAKVKSKILPNYYLKSFFKTHYFQSQLERHSVGSVQRGVYLSALEQIIVPVFDEKTHDEIATQEKLADDMVRASRSLTEAATLLVEALIEGQLDESLLKAAQMLLEGGNDSIDRSILNRLKTDGIDGRGQPLFSDLDELYCLLAQAQED